MRKKIMFFVVVAILVSVNIYTVFQNVQLRNELKETQEAVEVWSEMAWEGKETIWDIVKAYDLYDTPIPSRNGGTHTFRR